VAHPAHAVIRAGGAVDDQRRAGLRQLGDRGSQVGPRADWLARVALLRAARLHQQVAHLPRRERGAVGGQREALDDGGSSSHDGRGARGAVEGVGVEVLLVVPFVETVEPTVTAGGHHTRAPALQVDAAAVAGEALALAVVAAGGRAPRADDDGARVTAATVEGRAAGALIQVHRAVAGRFHHHQAVGGGRLDGLEDRTLPFRGTIARQAADAGLLLDEDHITRRGRGGRQENGVCRVVAQVGGIGRGQPDLRPPGDACHTFAIMVADHLAQHRRAVALVGRERGVACVQQQAEAMGLAQVFVVLPPAVLDVVDRDAGAAAAEQRPGILGVHPARRGTQVALPTREIGGRGRRDVRRLEGQRGRVGDFHEGLRLEQRQGGVGVGIRPQLDLIPEAEIRQQGGAISLFLFELLLALVLQLLELVFGQGEERIGLLHQRRQLGRQQGLQVGGGAVDKFDAQNAVRMARGRHGAGGGGRQQHGQQRQQQDPG